MRNIAYSFCCLILPRANLRTQRSLIEPWGTTSKPINPVHWKTTQLPWSIPIRKTCVSWSGIVAGTRENSLFDIFFIGLRLFKRISNGDRFSMLLHVKGSCLPTLPRNTHVLNLSVHFWIQVVTSGAYRRLRNYVVGNSLTCRLWINPVDSWFWYRVCLFINWEVGRRANLGRVIHQPAHLKAIDGLYSIVFIC